MKEIFQAFETRIRSPLTGYAAIAFFALNWKELFFLFASNSDAASRIEYFQEHTNTLSLLAYPFLIGGCLTVAYPWLNLFFLWVCRMPTEIRNTLQAQSEHKLLQKKEELERFRATIRAHAERDFIDEAKRDAELDKIDDEEAKSRARSKIDKLRSSHATAHGRESENPQYFLDKAEELKNVAYKVSTNSEEYKSLKKKIRALEKQAYEAVAGDDI